MERVVSATEARIHFGELMRRITEDKETVIVQHSGKPHIVLLSEAEYRRLLAAQERRADWKELVQRSREQIRAELGERELTPPEEIIRQMREER